MKLSEHFDSTEFNCKCCGKGGDKINPKLIELLEAIRDKVGEPIHINSGYRCEAHNKAVGGKSHSHHKLGNAADIHVKSLTPAQLHKFLEDHFKIGGMGLYARFVHVDVREGRARWTG